MILSEIKHLIKSFYQFKDFDLLIFSGGGQIDDYWGGPFGHPYSIFKWALIAKKTKPKLIFLSVGVCSLKSWLSRFFVRKALETAQFRSFRDRESKELLKNISCTSNDNVYPDIAFSYNIKNCFRAHKNAIDKGRHTVGIAPIAYLSKFDWPKVDITIFDNYIEILIQIISKLAKNGYSILFFATDSPDREVVDYILRLLKT